MVDLDGVYEDVVGDVLLSVGPVWDWIILNNKYLLPVDPYMDVHPDHLEGKTPLTKHLTQW